MHRPGVELAISRSQVRRSTTTLPSHPVYVCAQGDSYYKYDDDADKVVDGFPRKIAANFGAKPNGSDVIPDDLDAVLFDNRDSMIYFFKGDLVSYDVKLFHLNWDLVMSCFTVRLCSKYFDR